jgi:hypothetical protein
LKNIIASLSSSYNVFTKTTFSSDTISASLSAQ